MTSHDSAPLLIGTSVHFPVREGATVVNFDALAGVHAGDYGQQVDALSFHDRIDRDGTAQSTSGDPGVEHIVSKLTSVGSTFSTLDRYDSNNGIVNGPDYSDQDLDHALRFARDRHVLTTLEEHPLHMWNKVGPSGLPPVVANLYRSGAHKPEIAVKALHVALGSGALAKITVDADASRDTYVELGVPASMIEVIHNGIDTAKFKPSAENRAAIRGELEIGADDPVVLLIGRDSPEKDIPLFLKSAEKYLRADRNGHVIMAGPGLDLSNPHMQEMLAADLGDEELQRRLHVVGARPDFHKMYNAADVLALTSATESRPLCISEAQAAGIPVLVSTDVGDAASMIGNHGIITGRDPSEIAAAWQEAYDRRREIGYRIEDRDLLGIAPMVAKYARVIREAAN